MDEKTIVLVVFVLVYLYLIVFKHHRSHVVWAGVAAIFIFGIIKPHQLVTYINWNVIGILAGTLILAEFFIYSKIPVYMADIIVGNSRSAGSAMLRVCLMSGILSIFVENVAVVLIIAPIALEMVKRLKASPVPVIIGIAISSNLQGAAILIGDPPSMILAGFLKMNFNDFFIYHGKPGIFFAAELGAAASLLVLYLFFRKFRQPVELQKQTDVRSWVPATMLIVMLVGLTVAPIFDPDFKWLSSVICMSVALMTVGWGILRHGTHVTIVTVKKFDIDTTLFIAGIFVLVSTIEAVGLVDSLTKFLISILGSDVLINFLFIVIFSVAVSAIIDNVPFITIMIPVTYNIGKSINGSEYLLVFGLLIGTCIGGNITPIGAAANIVSVGILNKDGHRISFWTFIKIGLPFSIAATTASALFIWFVWR